MHEQHVQLTRQQGYTYQCWCYPTSTCGTHTATKHQQPRFPHQACTQCSSLAQPIAPASEPGKHSNEVVHICTSRVRGLYIQYIRHHANSGAISYRPWKWPWTHDRLHGIETQLELAFCWRMPQGITPATIQHPTLPLMHHNKVWMACQSLATSTQVQMST